MNGALSEIAWNTLSISIISKRQPLFCSFHAILWSVLRILLYCHYGYKMLLHLVIISFQGKRRTMPMVPHQKGIFKWWICLKATNLGTKSDVEEELKVIAVTKYQILLYKAHSVAIKETLVSYYSFEQFTLNA